MVLHRRPMLPASDGSPQQTLHFPIECHERLSCLAVKSQAFLKKRFHLSFHSSSSAPDLSISTHRDAIWSLLIPDGNPSGLRKPNKSASIAPQNVHAQACQTAGSRFSHRHRRRHRATSSHRMTSIVRTPTWALAMSSQAALDESGIRIASYHTGVGIVACSSRHVSNVLSKFSSPTFTSICVI